jgi:2-haloacid dehalogenase
MADRWTTYDCYGTLIDWRRGIGGVLSRLFGEQHRARLLGRYYEVEAAIQADGYRTYREVLDLGTARIAEEEERELTAGERTAMSESLRDWPAFPDTGDALGELRRRGWKLAILSNCDRDLIASSLPRLGAPVDLVIVAEGRAFLQARARPLAGVRRADGRGGGSPCARRPEPVPRHRPGERPGTAQRVDQPPG